MAEVGKNLLLQTFNVLRYAHTVPLETKAAERTFDTAVIFNNPDTTKNAVGAFLDEYL